MRRYLRIASLALAASISALSLAVPALASRNATTAQTRALTRAIQTTSVGGANRIPVSHYRVSRVKISSVSKAWASASIVPTQRYRSTLQGASVVAVKLAGTGTWVVVDLGTAAVGCGIAPNAVLVDLLGLKRGEQPCPSGEGIA